MSMIRIPTAAPLLALSLAAAFCVGCGTGIYDGRGEIEVTKPIGSAGGEIVLGQAKVTIGPSNLKAPTPIHLKRVPQISQWGAVGAIFELKLQEIGLLTQVATLEIEVPNIGANQKNLTLGMIDPTTPGSIWIPLSDSHHDDPITYVNGPLNPGSFSDQATWQFAAIVKCPESSDPWIGCPAGQSCGRAAVCQRCPADVCSH
jgi:hypothetical protein